MTVAGFGGTSAPDDSGFQVTFGGSLAGVDVSPLTLTNLVGATGFVGETAKVVRKTTAATPWWTPETTPRRHRAGAGDHSRPAPLLAHR